MSRLVLWTGTDAWRAEASQVSLEADRLSAGGTQLGAGPLPYRADYSLETGPGWVTRRLEVTATGDGWQRRLVLRSDGAGRWECIAERMGDVDLAPAGGDPHGLDGALDCDLAYSPLTNTMPILRHGLHRGPGSADFAMAWVSVPALSVHMSMQGYRHIRRAADRALVQYRSVDRTFTAVLEVDGDGIVECYPGLARRVAGPVPGRGRS